MTTQSFGEMPQKIGEVPQFWRICRVTWHSGEDMAADVFEYSGGMIEISANTCRNYMSNATEPNATRAFAIMAIADAILDKQIQERKRKRQKIRGAYERFSRSDI